MEGRLGTRVDGKEIVSRGEEEEGKVGRKEGGWVEGRLGTRVDGKEFVWMGSPPWLAPAPAA